MKNPKINKTALVDFYMWMQLNEYDHNIRQRVEKKADMYLASLEKPKFDINRDDLYEYNKPRARTKKRLKEMADCGMEEMSQAAFGYEGVMSGLYIERVWNSSDKTFSDYMKWAKELIAAHLKPKADLAKFGIRTRSNHHNKCHECKYTKLPPESEVCTLCLAQDDEFHYRDI